MSRLVVRMKPYHAYSLDGRTVPSVTTVAGVLDKPGLKWAAAKETAAWCATHAGELAAQGADAWTDTAWHAFDKEWKGRARTGTLVHAIAERLVWGEPVPDEDEDGLPWPDDVRRMGEQVARFMDAWDLAPVLVEAPLFNDEFGYAGRMDLVADLRGTRWAIDYKSGASGVYPEVALQLAGYGNATHVVVEGQDKPMTKVERYGSLWVRPDGWELIPVTVTEDTWRVFRACLFVYSTWSRLKPDDVVGAPLATPAEVAS